MKILVTTLFTLISGLSMAQIGWMSTFESIDLTKADSFWNGQDESKGFLNGNAFYRNNYNATWMIWNGFGVSNMKDSITPGYLNQYSARSANGANYTNQYAVVSQKGTVVLNNPQVIEGCYINNGTYPAISMSEGDGFAKQFGGPSGNDEDYFRIIATGHSGVNVKTDTFYLADYRFADNSKDYIVNEWTYFSLSNLGSVDSIVFSLESTDTGQHGMNTPAFFCMDNFNAPAPVVNLVENTFESLGLPADSFEHGQNHDGGFLFNSTYFVNEYNAAWGAWSSWAISTMTDTIGATYLNDKSSIVGKGAEGSNTYLAGYQRASILLHHGDVAYPEAPAGKEYTISISNSTYGYKTMLDGNAFAKKFGGSTGDDEDFLVLKISGVDVNGDALDTVNHYLADFRFADNAMDYISKEWEKVSVGQILANRKASRLDFWIEGSDTGEFGLNTPAYFCMDNFYSTDDAVSVSSIKPISINVYPNPATNLLYFDVESTVLEIAIYDLTGKLQVVSDANRRFINVSDLTPGVYTLKVSTSTGDVVTKFIKK